MFSQGCNWPPAPPAPTPSVCRCSGFTFIKHLFETMRQVFRNSLMATSVFFGVMTVWLLTPTCLLQGAAFLVLASGLGLPMPVLVAGQVLRGAVGCLGAAEPLLLVGLLVWAVHKMAVRRQPLVDRGYWRNRLGNLGAVINEECRQYQQQPRQYQHQHQHQH